MSSSAYNFEFTTGPNAFFPANHFAANVDVQPDNDAEIQPVFANDSDWLFTGMSKAPTDISDVIVSRLKEIPHVKSVLMGKSGEVFHVWTMIDEWNVTGRKAVYAAQKDLLHKLKGFDLDFYVVALDDGESPEIMVSDIPTVYQRP